MLQTHYSNAEEDIQDNTESDDNSMDDLSDLNESSNELKYPASTQVSDKNYQCPSCPYKTSRSGDLAKHVKGIHERN